MDFHFVLSLLYIVSVAFVLQMHRSLPIPLFYFSAKNITFLRRTFGVRRRIFLIKNIFIFLKKLLTNEKFCDIISRQSRVRVLFNGRMSAFQAECVGSIPITRLMPHTECAAFYVPLAQPDRATAF